MQIFLTNFLGMVADQLCFVGDSDAPVSSEWKKGKSQADKEAPWKMRTWKHCSEQAWPRVRYTAYHTYEVSEDGGVT